MKQVAFARFSLWDILEKADNHENMKVAGLLCFLLIFQGRISDGKHKCLSAKPEKRLKTALKSETFQKNERFSNFL